MFEDPSLSGEMEFEATWDAATAETTHSYGGVLTGKHFMTARMRAPSGAVLVSVDIFSDATMRAPLQSCT